MNDQITYTLTHPMMITSRLLPGVRIGDSFISVQPIELGPGGYRVTYWIDTPDGALYSGSDITIQYFDQRDIPREAIATLVSFLSADGEVYSGSGRMGTAQPFDGYGFNVDVAAWAYGMSDELSMLAMELDGEVDE